VLDADEDGLDQVRAAPRAQQPERGLTFEGGVRRE
jgi:hypothetical protein